MFLISGLGTTSILWQSRYLQFVQIIFPLQAVTVRDRDEGGFISLPAAQTTHNSQQQQGQECQHPPERGRD